MSRYVSLITGAVLATVAVTANAAPVIVGNGGTAVANGVVTAPPAAGPSFNYVSTENGIDGVGQIAGVGGTNGSTFTSNSFTSAAGGVLTFYFNFVTSDGTGDFPDYAWSALLSGSSTDYIFTARTTVSGDTVPGFGLPGLASVLTPATTPIIPGGPVWDKLGGSSGSCFGPGCGYTGWIKSTYTIANAGTYQLAFGVSNFGDTALQTGLAFTGAFIDDVPIGVPEPANWAMLIAGFGLTGAAMRRRRAVVAA